jgi:hypothetical protein
MEVKDFIIKKLNSDPDFKAKYEDAKNKKSIEAMEYAIHSNEISGNFSTEEDMEPLFKVAFDELSTEEFLNKILNVKKLYK